MTDRDSRDSGDELSEPEVAALLASLGDTEPLPDEVRGRLDDTLAALVRERGGESPTGSDPQDEESATVVPLRSRRRTAALGLLVAAAFLGVVGVGAAVVGGGLGGVVDGVDQVTAGDAAESGDAGSDAASEAGGGRSDRAQEEGPANSAPESAEEVPQDVTAMRGVPEVGTPRGLRSVVRGTAVRETAADEREALRDLADPRTGSAKAGCAVPRGAGAPGRAVTYRGDPATLVVRRDGEVLEGRVYSCALGLLLDGVRLVAPEE